MTISTFRNLEQQAIRQYRETKVKEVSQYYESFGQEKFQATKVSQSKKDLNTDTKTNKGKIDYYA